jgi:hypothetical protein
VRPGCRRASLDLPELLDPLEQSALSKMLARHLRSLSYLRIPTFNEISSKRIALQLLVLDVPKWDLSPTSTNLVWGAYTIIPMFFRIIIWPIMGGSKGTCTLIGDNTGFPVGIMGAFMPIGI